MLGDPAGDPQTQKMTSFGGKWSNGDQLWWTGGAKPGDKLEVALPVKAEGKHRVSVILTKARDYAVVRLSLDGKPPASRSTYNPTVIRTEPIPLGTIELSGAEHVLGAEIVGKNEKAVPSYMFGLDEVL